MCEYYRMSANGKAGILVCAIGCAKEDVVSELRGIAQVAYLDQITNIGSGRT